MKSASKAAIILITSVLFFIPHHATAGWFFDIYAGGAFDGNSKIELSTPFQSTDVSPDFDSGFVMGGRGGYWFANNPNLGFALDISFLRQEKSGIELDVIPISPLLYLQAQLQKSEEYPYGRYQPYIALGPSIFITKFDADLASLSGGQPIVPGVTGGTYAGEETVLGFDGRAGFKFKFAWNFAFLLEYRFTAAEPTYSETIFGTKVDADLRLQTHYALFGLSFEY